MKLPHKIVAVLSLAVLAGCAAPAATPVGPMPHPVVAGGRVFHVDVAEVQVSGPAAQPGTVVDLSGAVADWLRAHLVPVGTSGRIQANINNAEVRESVMRRTAPGGLSFERVHQFDGMIHVRLDATDRARQRAAFAGGEASRSRTVSDDMPAGQRAQVATGMADALMQDFAASLDADVSRRLVRFLR